MAGLLRMTRSTATSSDPAAVEIPRLADDSEYAKADELLTAFRLRLDRLQHEKIRLILLRELAGKPVDPRSTTDAQLRLRLAQLQALPPLASVAAPIAAAGTVPKAVAAGVAIMSGAAVTPAPPDHATQMQALDRQADVIGAAIQAQTEIVDAIAQELTVRYATQIKPAWDALQLEMYRSAQELARATARVQAMRFAINNAGIRSCSTVLSMPNVRSPLMLGAESEYGSEISTWRRTLEKLGIL
jgi:hypothetical protein